MLDSAQIALIAAAAAAAAELHSMVAAAGAIG